MYTAHFELIIPCLLPFLLGVLWSFHIDRGLYLKSKVYNRDVRCTFNNIRTKPEGAKMEFTQKYITDLIHENVPGG